MLRILIIIILIGYIIHKVSSFLLKGVYNRASGGGQFGKQRYSGNQKKAPDSNLNIDNIPGPGRKKSKGYAGGEYVDYEEVS